MNIPEKLKERLRAGKVIPFVGAGVSMSVRDRETGEPLFPNWRQLLERAADASERQDRTRYAVAIRAQLEFDKPDYLSIAQIAREGLIGTNWFDFLNSQFGKHPSHPCSIPAAVLERVLSERRGRGVCK